MQHSDFYIGLEFFAGPGFVWRCTDVGKRTITAIMIEEELDASWYNGPPYAVAEVVFDEYEIPSCYRAEEEGIEYAIYESNNSGHPGFPGEVVFKMMEIEHDYEVKEKYPNKPLLRLNRLREDGELLHSYAARKSGNNWLVCLYLPFTQEFIELPELDFLRLKIATAVDIKRRAKKSAKQSQLL